MLVPFLIMLREGVEAALIVGIVASYLRQTGRSAWMPAVWGGVVAAVGLVARGRALRFISRAPNSRSARRKCSKRLVGLIAVGILTSMVFWMRKAARSIKATLHASIDAALGGRLCARPAAGRRRVLRRGARGPGICVFSAGDL